MQKHDHAPRARFDTLFADPHHYRGDCRLLRTAIRRGWLNDATQEERDALVARFERAADERDAAGYVSDSQHVRSMLARCWTVIEMQQHNLDSRAKALRYVWDWEPTGQATGRPRSRPYVTDHPNRIDANEVRRKAMADRSDPLAFRAIHVCPEGSTDGRGWWVDLATAPDKRYGVRVALVCPKCKCRRRYLYLLEDGVRCRACAGIAYAPSAAPRDGA